MVTESKEVKLASSSSSFLVGDSDSDEYDDLKDVVQVEKKGKIEWDEPGKSGMLMSPYGSISNRVYLRVEGVCNALHGSLRGTINTPLLWFKGEVVVNISNLGCIVPAFSSMQRDDLHRLIKGVIPELMNAICALVPSSEFAFLAALGRKSNWKAACSVCSKEKNMGTMCTCGHTEIVVMRPCGHALCVRPCFADLVNTSGSTALEPKTFTTKDGQICIVGDELSVRMKDPLFTCPLSTCRSRIEDTFQAEEVYVPSVAHALVRKTAARICAAVAL